MLTGSINVILKLKKNEGKASSLLMAEVLIVCGNTKTEKMTNTAQMNF